MAPTYEIYRLKVSNGIFTNFTYIIVDNFTKLAAIVDPSWDMDLISDVIQRLNIRLKSILITHSHYDHTNLVSPLVERYEAAVFMHQAEIMDYQFECDNLTAFLDLEVLALGSTSIVCIWTPGHTSGGSSFLLSNDLFTGDTLFSEGVGVCFPENGGNPKDLFKSIQRLKTIIRNDVLIHPGHSFWVEPNLSFREIYETNIYLHFNRQDDFVAFRMRENQPPLFKWLD